jgi:hypothetical protein
MWPVSRHDRFNSAERVRYTHRIGGCLRPQKGLNAAALVYRAEENFLPLLRIESGLFGIQPVI